MTPCMDITTSFTCTKAEKGGSPHVEAIIAPFWKVGFTSRRNEMATV
jgi:hypothetical protein